MKQPKENYLIQTYEQAQSISKAFSYVYDTKIEQKHVRHFNLSDSMCSEVFIQDEQDHLFKFTFDLHHKESLFTEIAYPLTQEQKKHLIQIRMIKNILILHYRTKIKVINLEQNSVSEFSIKTKNILVTTENIYAYSNRTLYQFNLKSNTQNEQKMKGKFIDMSFVKGSLYLLVSQRNSYQIRRLSTIFNADDELLSYTELESKYLQELIPETEIIHFQMLNEDNFIVQIKENGLYYIDATNQTQELIFDKEISSFTTDCQGRLWILSQNRIYRFKQDIRYKEVHVFYAKFYSYKDETSWHSLVIDADIPEGTRMEVILDTYHGPTKPHINSKHFNKETQAYRNEKNILLYEKTGPRLLVKITLYSDSTQISTPIVRSIKAVFDKSSYLEYLPAFYSEDSESLYRFLAIFQTLMDETSNTIDNTAQLLDLNTTNDEFLSWLSQWLGLIRDYRWPQEKWRSFLLQAPHLYKIAGTKKGLSEIIKLYSGQEPRINEFFDEPDKREENPFFFCVELDADLNELDVAVIKSIVDEFKPAHTQAKVVLNKELIDNPNLTLNQSVVGYNTVIN